MRILILLIYCIIFTQSLELYKNSDILYLLKDQLLITQDISTTLQPTKSNYSRLFLPAETLFPDKKLTSITSIYLKVNLNPSAKFPLILFTLRDINNVDRFSLTFYKEERNVKSFYVILYYNPLSEKPQKIKFNLPFVEFKLWKFAISIKKRMIQMYTSCDDTKKDGSYQSHIIYARKKTLFQKGSIMWFFQNPVGSKSKLDGEIFDLIFSNNLSILSSFCKDGTIEGSGESNRGARRPERQFNGNFLIPQVENTTTVKVEENKNSPIMIRNTTKMLTRKSKSLVTNVTKRWTTQIKMIKQKMINVEGNEQQEDEVLEKCDTLDIRNKLIKKYGLENCTVMNNIRFSLPKDGDKGEKGEKGEQGPRGLKGDIGAPGSCDKNTCQPILNSIKGMKGDKGSVGECNLERCSVIKGGRGDPGMKGEPGEKGMKGESGYIDKEMVRRMTVSIIKSDLESMNVIERLKGPKGDPGTCASSCQSSANTKQGRNREINEKEESNKYDDTLNMGYGSLVFENRKMLESVSYKLPIGSMVFILKSDVFLVKVDQINNIWRSIALEASSKEWILPGPQPTPKIEFTKPPYVNGIYLKLHLVALNQPAMGDLKPSLRQPGGYSGALFQCQQAANLNGIARLMHPLLNTDAFNLKYSVPSRYQGIRVFNSRGEVLANNFVDLLSETETLQNEILDFDRNPISKNKLAPCIWMGKEIDKDRLDDYERNAESKCMNWMTRRPLNEGLAIDISSSSTNNALFARNNIKSRACSQQCYILCMQTEPTT